MVSGTRKVVDMAGRGHWKQEGKKIGRRYLMIYITGPEDKGVLGEGKMKILKMKISSH